MAPVDTQTAERIRYRKSQYCRWADTNDWDKFDGLMVPEFTFDTVDEAGKDVVLFDVAYKWKSRAEWVAYFKAHFAEQQTMHMTGPGELEQVGADEVKAIFGVMFFAGPKGPTGGVHVAGGGHYHETWVRIGDEWWMKDVKMMNLYYKVLPVP